MTQPNFARFIISSVITALLVGCGVKPAYKKADFDPAKLATPPHDLSAHDYPFDDDGTYRKDWVTNKNATRGSRWKPAAPAPQAAPPPPMVARAPSPPPANSSPPTVSAPRPAPTPAPKPAPKPQARYHTVARGDTLFSLSRRYGVSVGQLKSTNGLTSDVIRIGQTLRLP